MAKQTRVVRSKGLIGIEKKIMCGRGTLSSSPGIRPITGNNARLLRGFGWRVVNLIMCSWEALSSSQGLRPITGNNAWLCVIFWTATYLNWTVLKQYGRISGFLGSSLPTNKNYPMLFKLVFGWLNRMTVIIRG